MAIHLLLLFLSSIIKAQDIIYPKEDNVCELRNGGNGICKEGRFCPEAYTNFPTEQPVTCGFVGHYPNVCCPIKTDLVVKEPDTLVPILDISPPVVDFECGDSNPSTAFYDYDYSFDTFYDEPAPIEVSSSSSPSRVARSNFNATSGTAFTPSDPSFPHNVSEYPEYPEYTTNPGDIHYLTEAVTARQVLVKYSVLVGTHDPSGNLDWFCTGVLLNQQWVLTAAHCLVKNITVIRLGEHDYNDPSDGATPVDYNVSEIISYPEFSHFQGYHDLALIKLSSQVLFGEFINPVCLPWGFESEKDLTNQTILLTGWGATESGGSPSSILLEVNVIVFSNSVCEQSYSQLRDYNLVWPRGITQDMLCAGDPEGGGKDACQGDSGGPAVYLNNEYQYVLAGVVSRGYNCGLEEFPGTYANIHHPPYLAWIKKVAFQ